MEGRPDAELMARLVQGDEEALNALYDRHSSHIFLVAFRRLGDRQLAEEVMQETYLALWNRAELFDPALGSLLAWLSTIARNRSVDRMRALGRKPAPTQLGAMETAGGAEAMERAMATATFLGQTPPPDPEDLAEAAWLRGAVREALDAVPAVERRVIEMAYYEDLTQSEIAEQLGWPLGTVKTRTRRALLRLREVLASTIGEELGRRVAPVPVVERSGAGALRSEVADGRR